MRKLLLNEIRLELVLKVPEEARLLIAEAEREQEPRPDQSNKTQEVTVPVKSGKDPYLPGSSLKGVFRSRAEYIANLLNPAVGACHLFDRRPEKPGQQLSERLSCGDRFSIRVAAAERAGETLDLPLYYKDACPACQLFGHTFWAGRLRVSDFMHVGSEAQLQRQTHIAVDRITGGVAEDKLFRMEYASNAIFHGEITIENFSLWQIGWLGMLVRDLGDGLIKVGHKVSSGAGTIEVSVDKLRLRRLRGAIAPEPNKLNGVEALLSADVREQYGYSRPIRRLSSPVIIWKLDPGSVWHEATIKGDNALRLLEGARQQAADRLTQFGFIAEMKPDHLQRLLDEEFAVKEVTP